MIATTRPETLLGDTAVAVHPEDERYSHLHGKWAVLPLLKRRIPLLTDEYVDREFGSGALKITPAHDFNDYDLGKKHGLPMISVMGKDGKMTEDAGPYAGLKFSEARERVVEDLKASGELIQVEDHPHKVGLCQRCDQVAEPIISKQWFVKIAPLAAPAISAVDPEKSSFHPNPGKKPISNGCAIFGIGASLASSGGDIRFLPGIAVSAVRSPCRGHRLRNAPNVLLLQQS